QRMGAVRSDQVGVEVRVLRRLGSKHVLIVHGKDGMDEASLGAPTLVGELKDGKVHEYEIHPEDFGMAMVSNRSLKVENREESAQLRSEEHTSELQSRENLVFRLLREKKKTARFTKASAH